MYHKEHHVNHLQEQVIVQLCYFQLMHHTKGWIAVNIASFFFPYRECSALILRLAARFLVTWTVQGQVSSEHRIQLLTSGFSVTWYCCVDSLGKAMCGDGTLQQLERAEEVTFLTLLLKNVLFIYIFPPRCATREFNDKQTKRKP